VIVRNANPEQKDLFRSTVLSTLEKISNEGIDKEALEGSLNRMEFRLREGSDANTGINHSIRSVAGWMYAGDPFVTLEYGKPLAAVKSLYKGNYLEDIVIKQSCR
jgi:Zn-dependent M16 (insulinase) family peptidase